MRRRAPLLAALRRSLEIDASVRVLDLGGGTGALSEFLGRGSREVTVVEPSRRKVASGRRRRPQLRFVQTDAEHLPFEAGCFERVLSTMAYHHFQDPDRVLGETARVLTPAGRLVVADIDPTSSLGRRLRWFESSLLGRAHSFETRECVVARLRAHRLTLASEETIGPFYVVSAVRLEASAPDRARSDFAAAESVKDCHAVAPP